MRTDNIPDNRREDFFDWLNTCPEGVAWDVSEDGYGQTKITFTYTEAFTDKGKE